MIRLLAKFFIKNPKDYTNSEVREKYGVLSGIVGIFLNLILFGAKLFAGIICGAVSIMADAFNNLTDAGSSVISLVGFKISSKPVDEDHPFGHGRMEYVSGLVVAIIIMFVGFELFSSSIDKILNPEEMEFSIAVLVILILAVLTKLYMFLYNYSYGKKINSVSLKATAYDSVSDCVSTSVVLIGFIISPYLPFAIDGYIGLLVALFIFYTGIKSLKETVNVLLGEKPDNELVLRVEKFVLGFDQRVLGLHDLIIHNYGISRNVISLHCEVSAKEDINLIHDLIDKIEEGMAKEFNCLAVIHMDPIVIDDKKTNERKIMVLSLIREINPDLTIHDFRMTDGDTHINFIFDVVVPTGSKIKLKELENLIKQRVKELDQRFNAVVKAEYSFV